MVETGPRAYNVASFVLEALHCPDCANHIELAISKMYGVTHASVNFVSRKVKLEYDPQKITLAKIYANVKRLGHHVAFETVPLKVGDGCDIEGMEERVLLNLAGVVGANIDRTARIVNLSFLPAITNEKTLMYDLVRQGVTVERARKKHAGDSKKARAVDFKTAMMLASLLIIAVVVLVRLIGDRMYPQVDIFVSEPVFGISWALIASIIFGITFLRKAVLTAIHSKRLGMDALLSVAITAALIVGEDFAAIEVIGLTLLGGALEALTIAKMRKNIAGLIGKAPETAAVRHKGHVHEVPTSQIKAGDIVVVLGGQTIPVDGVIISGEGLINEAPVTGESLPVKKSNGARVFAGTINEAGAIDIKTTRVGTGTTVSKIVSLVEQAQESKSKIQRVGEKFTAVYVPLVFALSVLVYFLTWDPVRSISVLIIACPCAIVLAVPTAVIAGLANAAGRGILIKGGSYLEAAGQLDAVLTDKTGTLTFGRPRVKKVVSFGKISRDRIVKLSAIAAKNSRHPLSQAITDYAKFLNLKVSEPKKFREVTGAGVVATTTKLKQIVRLGSRRFVSKKKATHILQSELAKREESGDKLLWLSVNGKLEGVITVAETIRPHAKEAVDALRNEGVQDVVMLTGDHSASAKRVADLVGIKKVYFELLPKEKLDVIRKYKERGMTVAMIGDGVNDAPALALSDVGIAMGVAGTDAAIETANIALMSDDLTLIVKAIMLSKKTLRTIRHNLFFAISFNICGIVVAGFGFINPVVAAVVHNASSLAVIINSTRLLMKQKIFNNKTFPKEMRFPQNCIFNQCSFGDACTFKPNSQFSNNCTFGQNVRFNNALDSKLDYGSFCTFGDKCTFNQNNRVGAGCTFKDNASFEASASFGSYNLFGHNPKFGDACHFGSGTVFGTGAQFGKKTHLGPYCEVGSDSAFDSNSTFLAGCSFGTHVSFGKNCAFSNCRFDTGAVFGDGCKFGRYCSFPSNARFGKTCVRHLPYWVDGVLVRI